MIQKVRCGDILVLPPVYTVPMCHSTSLQNLIRVRVSLPRFRIHFLTTCTSTELEGTWSMGESLVHRQVRMRQTSSQSKYPFTAWVQLQYCTMAHLYSYRRLKDGMVFLKYGKKGNPHNR